MVRDINHIKNAKLCAEMDETFSFHIERMKDGSFVPVSPEGNSEIKVKASCLDIGEKYMLTITGKSTMQFEFQGVALF